MRGGAHRIAIRGDQGHRVGLQSVLWGARTGQKVWLRLDETCRGAETRPRRFWIVCLSGVSVGGCGCVWVRVTGRLPTVEVHVYTY